jgi:plasmid stability protein
MHLEPALRKAVKIHAVRKGTSVSALVRELLMTEIGWKATKMPADHLAPADIHRVLQAFAEGVRTRTDTMAALGIDPSDLGALARLMTESGTAWPTPDRARAETEADYLLDAVRLHKEDDR